MDDAVLEIEGLTVRSAEGDVLVKNVGLYLRRQECPGIAGESNSGGIITAKVIFHLLPQDLTAPVTHLWVLGEDLSNLPEKKRRISLSEKIGFVPQNTVAYLHPLIKIKSQLADGYHIHFQTSKKAMQKRAKTLLDWVGIRDVNRVIESYPAQISGGMRQRVNIAMALMCEPRVIITDEPATALDCIVKQQVIELFHSINEQQHVAIVMISHDLSLIRRYYNKVAIAYAEQIVESGGDNEVSSQPQHPYTQALLSVVLRLDQDHNVRLSEIPGYVPEHGRDTSRCLFQPHCSACRQECGDSAKSSRRDGHFVWYSKAWEECRARRRYWRQSA